MGWQDRFAVVYRNLKSKAAGVQLGNAVLCTDDQLEGCSVRLGASASISTNGKILTYLQVGRMHGWMNGLGEGCV